MKTQELNANSFGALILGTVLTLAISSFSGAAIAGSIGMAEALYGAIIGGVIGFCIACKTDIPIELAAVIGAVIGTSAGIIYAKTQESTNEKLDIDNSDYLKGLDCTKKAVLSHGQDAISCASGDFSACGNMLQGPAEIIVCMGDNDNNDGIIV